jgi:hypothetical protein
MVQRDPPHIPAIVQYFFGRLKNRKLHPVPVQRVFYRTLLGAFAKVNGR